MKTFILLCFSFLLVFLVSTCREKEDPITEEITYNYYFTFEAEGKEYFYGFDEIVDKYNPYELNEGKATQNFILVGYDSMFTLIQEQCGNQPERDCLLATFTFNPTATGTIRAEEFGVIRGNEEGYYVRFLNSNSEIGYLDITITKTDPVNHIIEASFSGQLYNFYTGVEVFVPVKGQFRAYYNPI